MLFVELSTKHNVELTKLIKDEANEWIGYLYSDSTLKLVHLSGKDLYEFPNVNLFAFCHLGSQTFLITIHFDSDMSTWTLYEYTGTSWNISSLEISCPKEIQIEPNQKLNQLPLKNGIFVTSMNGSIAVYSQTHHSLYIWNLIKNEAKYVMNNSACFNTFSKIYSISMSRTLVVLGSQSSVLIYNWRYIKSKEDQVGRTLYLPKRINEKVMEIKSFSNTKFIILLSSGDLLALCCPRPFEDDYFVKISSNTRIKSFDIVQNGKYHEPVLVYVGNSNRIQIASLLNLTEDKKESMDLEVSTSIIVKEEVDKLCAIECNRMILQTQSKLWLITN